MTGNALKIAQEQIATKMITRQVGNSRRSHVHHAYVFHALATTGCACRSNSLASISWVGTGGAFAGAFSTLGGAAFRIEAGMVRFAPQ